ncbi:MAG: hypothetical protein JWO82_3504 [Akkermansiaceae bacterium]|nr:hypothetical protein [Akkermansiaceae bacterium]
MNNPLDYLSSHFDALLPTPVEIDGLPFKLQFDPLNAEQTIAFVRASQAKTAAEQTTGFAQILVNVVKLEDGSPAFPLVKGGSNPVEVLTKRTDPTIFARMVKFLTDRTNAEEVADLEKKSAEPEPPGSSASTSSPKELAAASSP